MTKILCPFYNTYLYVFIFQFQFQQNLIHFCNNLLIHNFLSKSDLHYSIPPSFLSILNLSCICRYWNHWHWNPSSNNSSLNFNIHSSCTHFNTSLYVIITTIITTHHYNYHYTLLQLCVNWLILFYEKLLVMIIVTVFLNIV